MNPDWEDIGSNVAASYLPTTLNILAVFSLFSFLFHFAWEILQGPLFAGMSDARHAAATLICLQATLGDVAIALAGFTVAAWFGNGRGWYMTLPYRAVAAYVTTGVLISVVFEWYATQWAGRWAYSDLMPVIPLLRVGGAPVLQWVFLPFLVLYFLRGHNFGGNRLSQ